MMKIDLSAAIENVQRQIIETEHTLTELRQAERLLVAAKDEHFEAMLSAATKYGKVPKGPKEPATVGKSFNAKSASTRRVIEQIVTASPQPMRGADISAAGLALGRREITTTRVGTELVALANAGRIKRLQPGLYWKTDSPKGKKTLAALVAATPAPTNGNGNGDGHTTPVDIESAIRSALADGPLKTAALFNKVKRSIPKTIALPDGYMRRRLADMKDVKLTGYARGSTYALTT